jgi:spore coat protein U-like protein
LALGSSRNISKISTPSGLSNSTANAQINAEIKTKCRSEKDFTLLLQSGTKSRLAEIRPQQSQRKSV